MQHPRIDTSSLDPCWGKEKQIVSVHVLLTEVSHNFGIHASAGNLVSSGSGNMSPVLADQES